MEQLLSDAILQQLRDVFKEIQHPVEVLFFADRNNAEVSEFSAQMLTEVGGVDERITIGLYDIETDHELAKQYRVDKAPGFVILGREPDGSRIDFGVRFAGFPGNYEFTSFINDIMLVSRRESGLKQATKEALAALKEPLHLMVFVTPT